jgi:hypothetical protein
LQWTTIRSINLNQAGGGLYQKFSSTDVLWNDDWPVGIEADRIMVRLIQTDGETLTSGIDTWRVANFTFYNIGMEPTPAPEYKSIFDETYWVKHMVNLADPADHPQTTFEVDPPAISIVNFNKDGVPGDIFPGFVLKYDILSSANINYPTTTVFEVYLENAAEEILVGSIPVADLPPATETKEFNFVVPFLPGTNGWNLTLRAELRDESLEVQSPGFNILPVTLNAYLDLGHASVGPKLELDGNTYLYPGSTLRVTYDLVAGHTITTSGIQVVLEYTEDDGATWEYMNSKDFSLIAINQFITGVVPSKDVIDVNSIKLRLRLVYGADKELKTEINRTLNNALPYTLNKNGNTYQAGSKVSFHLFVTNTVAQQVVVEYKYDGQPAWQALHTTTTILANEDKFSLHYAVSSYNIVPVGLTEIANPQFRVRWVEGAPLGNNLATIKGFRIQTPYDTDLDMVTDFNTLEVGLFYPKLNISTNVEQLFEFEVDDEGNVVEPDDEVTFPIYYNQFGFATNNTQISAILVKKDAVPNNTNHLFIGAKDVGAQGQDNFSVTLTYADIVALQGAELPVNDGVGPDFDEFDIHLFATYKSTEVDVLFNVIEITGIGWKLGFNAQPVMITNPINLIGLPNPLYLQYTWTDDGTVDALNSLTRPVLEYSINEGVDWIEIEQYPFTTNLLIQSAWKSTQTRFRWRQPVELGTWNVADVKIVSGESNLVAFEYDKIPTKARIQLARKEVEIIVDPPVDPCEGFIDASIAAYEFTTDVDNVMSGDDFDFDWTFRGPADGEKTEVVSELSTAETYILGENNMEFNLSINSAKKVTQFTMTFPVGVVPSAADIIDDGAGNTLNVSVNPATRVVTWSGGTGALIDALDLDFNVTFTVAPSIYQPISVAWSMTNGDGTTNGAMEIGAALPFPEGTIFTFYILDGAEYKVIEGDVTETGTFAATIPAEIETGAYDLYVDVLYIHGPNPAVDKCELLKVKVYEQLFVIKEVVEEENEINLLSINAINDDPLDLNLYLGGQMEVTYNTFGGFEHPEYDVLFEVIIIAKDEAGTVIEDAEGNMIYYTYNYMGTVEEDGVNVVTTFDIPTLEDLVNNYGFVSYVDAGDENKTKIKADIQVYAYTDDRVDHAFVYETTTLYTLALNNNDYLEVNNGAGVESLEFNGDNGNRFAITRKLSRFNLGDVLDNHRLLFKYTINVAFGTITYQTLPRFEVSTDGGATYEVVEYLFNTDDYSIPLTQEWLDNADAVHFRWMQNVPMGEWELEDIAFISGGDNWIEKSNASAVVFVEFIPDEPVEPNPFADFVNLDAYIWELVDADLPAGFSPSITIGEDYNFSWTVRYNDALEPVDAFGNPAFEWPDSTVFEFYVDLGGLGDFDDFALFATKDETGLFENEQMIDIPTGNYNVYVLAWIYDEENNAAWGLPNWDDELLPIVPILKDNILVINETVQDHLEIELLSAEGYENEDEDPLKFYFDGKMKATYEIFGPFDPDVRFQFVLEGVDAGANPIYLDLENQLYEGEIILDIPSSETLQAVGFVPDEITNIIDANLIVYAFEGDEGDNFIRAQTVINVTQFYANSNANVNDLEFDETGNVNYVITKKLSDYSIGEVYNDHVLSFYFDANIAPVTLQTVVRLEFSIDGGATYDPVAGYQYLFDTNITYNIDLDWLYSIDGIDMSQVHFRWIQEYAFGEWELGAVKFVSGVTNSYNNVVSNLIPINFEPVPEPVNPLLVYNNFNAYQFELVDATLPAGISPAITIGENFDFQWTVRYNDALEPVDEFGNPAVEWPEGTIFEFFIDLAGNADPADYFLFATKDETGLFVDEVIVEGIGSGTYNIYVVAWILDEEGEVIWGLPNWDNELLDIVPILKGNVLIINEQVPEDHMQIDLISVEGYQNEDEDPAKFYLEGQMKAIFEAFGPIASGVRYQFVLEARDEFGAPILDNGVRVNVNLASIDQEGELILDIPSKDSLVSQGFIFANDIIIADLMIYAYEGGVDDEFIRMQTQIPIDQFYASSNANVNDLEFGDTGNVNYVITKKLSDYIVGEEYDNHMLSFYFDAIIAPVTLQTVVRLEFSIDGGLTYDPVVGYEYLFDTDVTYNVALDWLYDIDDIDLSQVHFRWIQEYGFGNWELDDVMILTGATNGYNNLVSNAITINFEELPFVHPFAAFTNFDAYMWNLVDATLPAGITPAITIGEDFNFEWTVRYNDLLEPVDEFGNPAFEWPEGTVFEFFVDLVGNADPADYLLFATKNEVGLFENEQIVEDIASGIYNVYVVAWILDEEGQVIWGLPNWDNELVDIVPILKGNALVINQPAPEDHMQIDLISAEGYENVDEDPAKFYLEGQVKALFEAYGPIAAGVRYQFALEAKDEFGAPIFNNGVRVNVNLAAVDAEGEVILDIPTKETLVNKGFIFANDVIIADLIIYAFEGGAGDQYVRVLTQVDITEFFASTNADVNDLTFDDDADINYVITNELSSYLEDNEEFNSHQLRFDYNETVAIFPRTAQTIVQLEVSTDAGATFVPVDGYQYLLEPGVTYSVPIDEDWFDDAGNVHFRWVQQYPNGEWNLSNVQIASGVTNGYMNLASLPIEINFEHYDIYAQYNNFLTYDWDLVDTNEADGLDPAITVGQDFDYFWNILVDDFEVPIDVVWPEGTVFEFSIELKDENDNPYDLVIANINETGTFSFTDQELLQIVPTNIYDVYVSAWILDEEGNVLHSLTCRDDNFDLRPSNLVKASLLIINHEIVIVLNHIDLLGVTGTLVEDAGGLLPGDIGYVDTYEYYYGEQIEVKYETFGPFAPDVRFEVVLEGVDEDNNMVYHNLGNLPYQLGVVTAQLTLPEKGDLLSKGFDLEENVFVKVYAYTADVVGEAFVFDEIALYDLNFTPDDFLEVNRGDGSNNSLVFNQDVNSRYAVTKNLAYYIGEGNTLDFHKLKFDYMELDPIAPITYQTIPRLQVSTDAGATYSDLVMMFETLTYEVELTQEHLDNAANVYFRWIQNYPSGSWMLSSISFISGESNWFEGIVTDPAIQIDIQYMNYPENIDNYLFSIGSGEVEGLELPVYAGVETEFTWSVVDIENIKNIWPNVTQFEFVLHIGDDEDSNPIYLPMGIVENEGSFIDTLPADLETGIYDVYVRAYVGQYVDEEFVTEFTWPSLDPYADPQLVKPIFVINQTEDELRKLIVEDLDELGGVREFDIEEVFTVNYTAYGPWPEGTLFAAALEQIDEGGAFLERVVLEEVEDKSGNLTVQMPSYVNKHPDFHHFNLKLYAYSGEEVNFGEGVDLDFIVTDGDDDTELTFDQDGDRFALSAVFDLSNHSSASLTFDYEAIGILENQNTLPRLLVTTDGETFDPLVVESDFGAFGYLPSDGFHVMSVSIPAEYLTATTQFLFVQNINRGEDQDVWRIGMVQVTTGEINLIANYLDENNPQEVGFNLPDVDNYQWQIVRDEFGFEPALYSGSTFQFTFKIELDDFDVPVGAEYPAGTSFQFFMQNYPNNGDLFPMEVTAVEDEVNTFEFTLPDEIVRDNYPVMVHIALNDFVYVSIEDEIQVGTISVFNPVLITQHAQQEVVYAGNSTSFSATIENSVVDLNEDWYYNLILTDQWGDDWLVGAQQGSVDFADVTIPTFVRGTRKFEIQASIGDVMGVVGQPLEGINDIDLNENDDFVENVPFFPFNLAGEEGDAVYLTTVPLDLTAIYSVKFDVEISELDLTDLQKLVLEYSLDGGLTYTAIHSYPDPRFTEDDLFNWFEEQVALPEDAQTEETILRWRIEEFTQAFRINNIKLAHFATNFTPAPMVYVSDWVPIGKQRIDVTNVDITVDCYGVAAKIFYNIKGQFGEANIITVESSTVAPLEFDGDPLEFTGITSGQGSIIVNLTMLDEVPTGSNIKFRLMASDETIEDYDFTIDGNWSLVGVEIEPIPQIEPTNVWAQAIGDNTHTSCIEEERIVVIEGVQNYFSYQLRNYLTGALIGNAVIADPDNLDITTDDTVYPFYDIFAGTLKISIGAISQLTKVEAVITSQDASGENVCDVQVSNYPPAVFDIRPIYTLHYDFTGTSIWFPVELGQIFEICDGGNTSDLSMIYWNDGNPVMFSADWYRVRNNVTTLVGTGNTYSVTESGTYYAIVNDGNCGQYQSMSINVIVNEKPSQPSISIANGITQFCDGGSTVLTATAGYSYYRWFKNGTSLGDVIAGNSQSIVVNETGSYRVRVSNVPFDQGCFSVLSNPAYIEVIEFTDVTFAATNIKLCPDGDGIAQVTLTGIEHDFIYYLVDAYTFEVFGSPFSSTVGTVTFFTDPIESTRSFSVLAVSNLSTECTKLVSDNTLLVEILPEFHTLVQIGNDGIWQPVEAETSYCTDDLILTLGTADGNNNNFPGTAKWFRDGLFVFDGQTLDLNVNGDGPGVYQARFTYDGDDFCQYFTEEVIITGKPTRPVLTYQGQLNICEGEGGLTLTAPAGFAAYKWYYKGDQTVDFWGVVQEVQIPNVSPSDNVLNVIYLGTHEYWVEVVTEFGCVSDRSLPITASVFQKPQMPQYTVLTEVLCGPGVANVLLRYEDIFGIIWNPEEDVIYQLFDVITGLPSGQPRVGAPNQILQSSILEENALLEIRARRLDFEGCIEVSMPFEVVVQRLNILVSGNKLIASIANYHWQNNPHGAISYQWYRNGVMIINGGNNQTLNIYDDAEYRVVVVTFDGCILETTINKAEDNPVEDEVINTLVLFPNPASDFVTVNYTSEVDEDLTIKVVSVRGDVVYEAKLIKLTSELKHQIPITNLANGIYIIHVVGRDNVKVQQFIKF